MSRLTWARASDDPSSATMPAFESIVSGTPGQCTSTILSQFRPGADSGRAGADSQCLPGRASGETARQPPQSRGSSGVTLIVTSAGDLNPDWLSQALGTEVRSVTL